MSLAKKVEIDCPGCNNRIPFQMWNGVNVNVNPELREKVLSGEIFDARCSLCGAVVSVVHPLLYNDMESHFWVQLESQDADDSMLGKALPAIANQPMQGYRSRVVFDLAELKEKIMIFENGLDDRVMEVMKFLLRKNVWEAERPMLDGPLWFYELIKDRRPIHLALPCCICQKRTRKLFQSIGNNSRLLCTRGEISFWGCSCLPAFKNPDISIYSRVNIYWQEVFTIF